VILHLCSQPPVRPPAMGGNEPSEAAADFVLAARYGDLDDVTAALEAGIEVDAESHGGATALLMASGNGHLDIVSALLGARASLEIANESGSRPLHWAALNGHLDVCKALLEARADTNARNEFRKKPFDEAFGRSFSEVCELLAPATDFSEDAPTEEECVAREAKGGKEVSPTAPFEKGARVVIHGTSREELNGLSGEAGAYDAKADRLVVTLGDGRQMRFKPTNLRAEAPETAEVKEASQDPEVEAQDTSATAPLASDARGADATTAEAASESVVDKEDASKAEVATAASPGEEAADATPASDPA